MTASYNPLDDPLVQAKLRDVARDGSAHTGQTARSGLKVVDGGGPSPEQERHDACFLDATRPRGDPNQSGLDRWSSA